MTVTKTMTTVDKGAEGRCQRWIEQSHTRYNHLRSHGVDGDLPKLSCQNLELGPPRRVINTPDCFVSTLHYQATPDSWVQFIIRCQSSCLPVIRFLVSFSIVTCTASGPSVTHLAYYHILDHIHTKSRSTAIILLLIDGIAPSSHVHKTAHDH